MFGGPNQWSYFDQIDYHANYLVGVGSSLDPAISGNAYTSNNWRPVIIAYSSSNFDYQWGKIFDVTDQGFYGVKINRYGDKVAVSSQYKNLYIIVLNIANGNILSTTHLTTIDNSNKYHRKLLLLDTGDILLGDNVNIYKIDPSNPTAALKYTTTNYKTIWLQNSSDEVYLHVFQLNSAQNKCLISIVFTANLTSIHQNEVQCTGTELNQNLQMGYCKLTQQEDLIVFQIGTKFFRIITEYLVGFPHTASMMKDSSNPDLQAKGLLCINASILYSLMYGNYATQSNRLLIAEANFQTNKITYRRYLQAATEINIGVIYEFDKFFIASSGQNI
ncbi:hypothetical protein FGO68_gene12604 [Halteria grandinella]|uniref:Uncharacterized protein n=1 Tax=Halteria grandinella TaxID=5974 RepID=A0A8J8P1Z9_HALGN|nr:hypothetical protein FGO68_gene12604 [Halteria grandinella]